MEEITVVIPQQEYDWKKYAPYDGECYLQKALKEKGYEKVLVYGWGRTSIDNEWYYPKEDFNSNVLQNNLPFGDVSVTLIKQ